MSEGICLVRLHDRGALGHLLVLVLASLLLSACGASVQRSYAYSSPGYPRYVVVTPAPLPEVAAPQVAAPRVVIAAPPLAAPRAVVAAPPAAEPNAASAGAPYTPVASPLLAAFDSRPRGVAPSQPDYDAYVRARAEESRPYYVYRPSYGYRPYYGYGPSYGYAPYYGYGPRFGVALPLWGAWRARSWSNHWHGGGHHWHGPRGGHAGWHEHGGSGGGVHHAGPRHSGSHGGGRRR